jgi:hypothetical protein
MGDLFWDQEAGLSRTVMVDELGGWPFAMGEDIAQGTLEEMLDRYLGLSDEERPRMTITISGGFHLEGHEIDALAARRRRERGGSDG